MIMLLFEGANYQGTKTAAPIRYPSYINSIYWNNDIC